MSLKNSFDLLIKDANRLKPLLQKSIDNISRDVYTNYLGRRSKNIFINSLYMSRADPRS